LTKSTVIIPVFDQAALTKQCLETILGREDCEVIVVNDRSTDGTAELLADFGARIKVITHRHNSGFAKSCNDGAAAARTKYLVFLNNDTIPQPGWLLGLEHYADQHPRATVVGAKLLYPVNTIQHAGVVICQDRYPRHIYSGFPGNHPAVNKSRRFQIVTAACMLVRRKIFEVAGGFDMKFRNGFEDVDLCLRLGERGHEIHYCAQSVVQHLESVSPGRFKRDKDNVALYRERWLPHVQPDDIRYYLEDGLLKVSYEGTFPIQLEVSPELAVLNTDARENEAETLLAARARQVADLTRQNTCLALELGRQGNDSPELRYQELQQHIRETVLQQVPAGATVLVASKGDGNLLDFPGRRGWHFPQTERGTYAGHHPANSTQAIAHLETMRARGAEYLLIPATSHWWLDHYTDFRQYLNAHATLLAGPENTCLIYELKQTAQPKTRNARTQVTT
jgi:GT2 family glycosyltransferase